MNNYLHYVVGDATSPKIEGPKFIAHGCNNLGAWGAGFVLAVSKKWPQAKQRYHEFCKNERPQDLLGRINFVKIDQQLWIANMITQHGLRGPSNPVPVSYAAIAGCFDNLRMAAKDRDATVHMPRIGCGLGGGSWDRIESLLQGHLVCGEVHTYVYDLV